METPKCKKCKKPVIQGTMKCPHCGVSNPVTGITDKIRKTVNVLGLGFIIFIFAVVIFAPPSEDSEPESIGTVSSSSDEETVRNEYGEAPPDIARDVTLNECGFTEPAGGRPYATGSITNSHEQTLTYTIDVQIVVTDITIPSAPDAPEPYGVGPAPGLYFHVEEVEPGESVDWHNEDELWMGPDGLNVPWEGTAECSMSVTGYSWL